MTLPVYTNHFYSEDEEIIFTRSIWDDPDLLSFALGYTVVPPTGDVSAYPLLSSPTGVYGFPASATRVSESILAIKLNRATAPNAAASFEFFGPINPIDPAREVESCALYNVKSWRINGEVESKTFDYVVPAGAGTVYNDDEIFSQSDVPTRRGYYATGLRAFLPRLDPDDPDDNSAEIFVGIGRGPFVIGTGTNPGEPIEAMHSSPSYLLNMPALNVRLTTGGRTINTVGGLGAREPGDTDGSFTFLGRPLQTKVTSMDPPTSYSISIAAQEYWAPNEWL